MFSLSNLTATATAALTCIIMSPSRNACMKRVAPTRFRYEPYGASVMPSTTITTTTTYSPIVEVMEAPMQRSPVTATSLLTTPATSSTTTTPLMTTPSSVIVPCAAAAVPAPSVRFVVVKFKHESSTFLAPFRVAVDDLVVVEGDRGEDIGIVVSISKEAPEFDVVRQIIRRATAMDREALAAQREKEQEAIRTTTSLAQTLKLQAYIEDVEYQFDLNKLTVFVTRASKTGFVDFRKLQRALFRQFRCRIWCAYMDEVVSAEAGPRMK